MKNKVKFKNKFIMGLSMLAIGATTLPFMQSVAPYNVLAYNPETVVVSNGDFENTSSSSYPKTASDWSMANGSGSANLVKAGVISTIIKTFEDNYKEYGLGLENTADLENSENLNVYMINAQKNSLRYGVKSSSISLDADSYYRISVDVKTSLPVLDGSDSDETISLSSVASVYLNIGDEDYKFVARDTHNNWDTFAFYVHTNKFESVEANIELWLGSKSEVVCSGAVLFDNVKAEKRSSENWYEVEDENNKVVELDDYDYDATYMIDNAGFEEPYDNLSWEAEFNENNDSSKTFSGVCVLGRAYNVLETNIADNPKTDGNRETTHALFINNEDFAGVAYNSNKFKVERYTNYLLQVYAKTGTFENGGAYIEVVPTNDKLSSVKLSNIVTSKVENSITNDWKQYSFYIQGSPYGDEEIYLRLGLGDLEGEENLQKGYVFFDDVTLAKITFKQFDEGSDTSFSKIIKLHEVKDDGDIHNGFFNYVDNAFTGEFPLLPSEWTVLNEDNTTSGIISTKKDDFNSKTADYYGNLPWDCVGYTNLQDESVEDDDNNLLMIYNPTSDYQKFTSSSFTLSKDNRYKLSIEARTLSQNSAYINVKLDGRIINKIDVSSNNGWTTYETYLNMGLTGGEITVELGFGTEDNLAVGYAFFDNVMIETITEDDYNNAKDAGDATILDFSVENFAITTGETNGEYLVPSNWSTLSGSEALTSVVGIEQDENGNALIVSTAKDNGSVKSTSSNTYKLKSGTYYIVTFKIKTSEFKNLVNSGVSFGFSQNENVFKNVVANGEDYVEYKFYINGSQNSDLTPFIQVDVENATSSEFVKLSEISFEVITESAFNEKFEEVESDSTINNVVFLGNVTSDDEDSDDKETPNYVPDNSNDWYLIPTIITTLALIIAVVGVIRNRKERMGIQKKERPKKVVTQYDRDVTLHKALVDREAEKIRKEKLEELKAKLKVADEELEQIENDYKEKLAGENVNAEHEFKKYAKNRKKVATKKEKLEEEKAYVQSDEFLQEAQNQVIENYESENASATEETDEVVVEEQADSLDEVVVEDVENKDAENNENK